MIYQIQSYIFTVLVFARSWGGGLIDFFGKSLRAILSIFGVLNSKIKLFFAHFLNLKE